MKKIVIVGGGTAGWMSALIMAREWSRQGVSICLVESPEVGIIGVGEGSTPALKLFFDRLNIAEQEWMPACNATYKCGIRFDGWSTHAGFESYFHPFSAALDRQTLPMFMHNAQARLRGANVYAQPDRFFIASRLAQQCLAPVAPSISRLMCTMATILIPPCSGNFYARKRWPWVWCTSLAM
ncbi:tryptophan 7-halogenase [Cellvibrio sp. PSBB023]|uniref:tryptophan 7-halogenase n=1 Tax=Cellvibrio sp. PSBB023 TaxID=1945512 RepID=UPI00211051FD|nr:tryptophan 7-halogenase [Cellvibrio sp. PSBB023]